ncbi:metalloregulator ArsR/SmtB family transcription factor [Marinomonas dokdonensis]|uniref:metalloregulator ArsR/SmtB family transcription factor n=1 Tax=Marinomonas dokdonensis TaxID=328224 RepID=UPI0040557521
MTINPIKFYKCLADETRLRSIILIQREQELCVCELMAALDETQPKVSRHLALLRRDGLLTDRRQGQWVYYKINPQLPQWAVNVITETSQSNGEFIEENLTKLQQMGDRPERQSCC